MISTKNRGTINNNIQTSNGMLYENTKVKIISTGPDKIQVSDMAGRIFWVKHTDISV